MDIPSERIGADIIGKIRHVLSRGLVFATLLRWLSHAGITAVPYFLYKESREHLDRSRISYRPEAFEETLIFSKRDPSLIKMLKGCETTAEEFENLWEEGSVCIVLKDEESIKAYGWYNLKRCCYRYLTFDLKSHEAYAFNFNTARHMRGKNVAPFLRMFLYDHLGVLGKDWVYSITEVVNTPAIKYKKSVNANPLCCYLYLNLIDKFTLNVLIRNFGKQEQ